VKEERMEKRRKKGARPKQYLGVTIYLLSMTMVTRGSSLHLGR
jgi:hypothetical protein